MKVPFDDTRMGEDWVYLQPVISDFRKEMELENLPNMINCCLRDWLKDHPDYRVRATFGVVEGGSTVGLHVWYDVV